MGSPALEEITMAASSKIKMQLDTLTGRGMLPKELRHASGMKRLNYIQELADTASFVRELAAQELYLLIRDIGKADAFILLEYAEPEQLLGIMDIEMWHKDGVELSRWMDWLELAQTCNFDTALRYIEATESELLQLLFTREIRIHARDLDKDMVPDDLELHTSPDFMFYFTLPVGHEMAERLPLLLKMLWAANPERIRDVCQAARFDLPTPIQETLYRFRNGRLEDMGFGNPEEVEELFELVNPKSLRNQARKMLEEFPELRAYDAGALAQDLVLKDIATPDLLASAVSGLDDDARANFAQAFGFLVNKVFFARTKDLSMTEELPEAGAHVAALVNLGLAYVSDESLEVATRVLQRIWPQQLFQAGHSLTMLAGLKARRIRLRCGAERGLVLFGERLEAGLAAISQPWPMFASSLDSPEEIGTRWLATPADLALIETRIDFADGVLTFFEERLGFSPDALINAHLGDLESNAVQNIRFATLFRTGFAQLVLTDEFSFAPLDKSDLVAFLGLSLKDNALSPTMASIVGKLKENTPADASAFIDDALDELVLAMGRVHDADITPEYAAELFLIRSA
jgi:hypothetical protein